MDFKSKEAAIRKLENLENYKNNFSILDFAEKIKVTPRTWSQSRVGRDDYWGIDLALTYSYDPYFILNKLLHPEDISFKLWQDSGYTSGSNAVREYEEAGMAEEWAEAKKVENQLRERVTTKYDRQAHFDTLTIIDYLDERELLTLNSIYWYLSYTKAYRLVIYKNKGTIIDKYRYQLASNLDVKKLHKLVKKGIVKFAFDLEIINSRDDIRVYTYYEWMTLPVSVADE